MKILNICNILPLERLKKENDINIKIQQEINKINPSIEFVFLKSLPSTNFILSKLKPLWKEYYLYIKQKETYVGGYKTLIYPWFRLPTSDFTVEKNLIFLNRIWNLKYIERLIGDEINSFDLIIAQNNIADGIVANYLSKKYDIPYIHTLRGEMNDQIYKAKFFQTIIEQAAKCITPSPTIYKFMLEKNKKITFCPHGVDDKFFFKGYKNFSKAKFITVARLLSLKNIDFVLRSLKKAKDKGFCFEYKIIGDGPERSYLESLSSELELDEHVVFLGWLDKKSVIKHLFEANIFIMPSIPETLGRVYLEAAAAGCLIIGHKNSGVDGFFIDRESAIFSNLSTLDNDIIEVLKSLNGEEVQTYINSAKKLVYQLKWEKVSNKYIKLFNEILNK